MNKLKCGWVLLTGWLFAGSLQAAIAPPDSCSRIVAVSVSGQLPFVERGGGRLLADFIGRLEKASGLEIHVQQVAGFEEGLRSFASGQLDMWLGARLEFLQLADAWLIEPPVWQAWHRLWFRSGELGRLDEVPRLRGLRPVWWAEQVSRGLLTPWLDEMEMTHGFEVADRQAAVQAVLLGAADFFLADELELRQDLPGLASRDDFEPLQVHAVPEPVYLALSSNSACNDERLRQRLAAALEQMGTQALLGRMLQQAEQ